MRLTLHRGAREIGGTCVSVESGASRIVLDVGLPLETDGAQSGSLPDAPGLFDTAGSRCDGILVSHAHADHTGLVQATRAEIPVWLSKGTSKMILAGSVFAKQPTIPFKRTNIFTAKVPFRLGDFTITPYPVDHSVFDAMAFLIEAGGHRLLYTGDLRFHGRKPGMAAQLESVCRKKPLTALLIEGTRLGPREAEENLSEAQLEDLIRDDLRACKGLALAMYSPLNVDRFVTWYRAATRSQRTFVIDPYQAFVLHLLQHQAKLPLPHKAPNLRVLLPPNFRKTAADRRLGHTDWAASLPDAAISQEEISRAPERYILLYRASMQAWFLEGSLPPLTTGFFSYWPGYLKEKRTQDLKAAVLATGGAFLPRHASGHAHPRHLRAFVEKVKPHALFPVHTQNPEKWKDLWPRTRVLENGETVDIKSV